MGLGVAWVCGLALGVWGVGVWGLGSGVWEEVWEFGGALDGLGFCVGGDFDHLGVVDDALGVYGGEDFFDALAAGDGVLEQLGYVGEVAFVLGGFAGVHWGFE